MTTAHDTQNEDISSLPVYEDELQNDIIFYSLKFHFIMVSVMIAMAIVHLVFAIRYLGECPVQSMINVYMIVHAAGYLSLILLNSLGVINIRCIYPRYKDRSDKRVPRTIFIVILIFTLILFLFNLVWLIVGSVWIFGAKADGVQGSNPTVTTTYCQSDFYKVALALVIVNYVLYSLIIVLCCGGHIYDKN